MIKKLVLLAIILGGISLNAFSEWYTITVTPNQQDPHSWEGSTINYTVSFNGTVPPGTVFGANAINGTVIAYSINPNTQSYVTVQWNCKVTTGSIQILDETNKPAVVVHTYTTPIWTYSNYADFCNQTAPLTQSLLYGQTPNQLVVNGCTPFCYSQYSFQFKWQTGDVAYGVYPQEPTTWTDISGATGASYSPPTYNATVIKAYRRVTSVVENGITYTYNSKTAIVNFNEPFDPGVISGSGFAYYNTLPDITQTGAAGGWACNGLIQYTWEKSENNGPWMVIGLGQAYPNDIQTWPNLLITVDSRFRRHALCGNSSGYSNIISYIIRPPLYPGELFMIPPGTIPYGTVPGINATSDPATGGLCLSSNYLYTWERSVENGPWQVISSGVGSNYQGYPSGVGIVGNSRFRRKVTCGNESLYTNELSFTMSTYTSPNVENLNYVRVNNMLIPGVNNWPQADNLPTGDKIQITTYYDGLGRPIQSVSKETSEISTNTWADMTGFNEYDIAGRVPKSYLSYPSTTTIGKFKVNAKTEQATYIQNTFSESVNAPTYTLTTFESSPFNRVFNVKKPGDGWLTSPGSSFQYEFNTAAEHIKIWKIGFAETDIPYVDGEYGEGKLYKAVSVDEKQMKVYEYKDFSGNLILKKVQLNNIVSDNSNTGWLCTFYVYDDLGQLRSTITPKAVSYLEQHSWSFASTDVYKELCFYEYFDERGRTVIKHSAGAGEIHLVYDKRNRLVLSQDERQRNRTNKQWAFYLYDGENRQLVSGLYDNTNDRNTLQYTYMPNQNFGDVQVNINTGSSETITVNNPVAGSSTYCMGCTANTTFINSVTYYDNYNYSGAKNFTMGFAFPSTSNPYVEPSQNSGRVLGMETGSKVRVLDSHHDDLNYNQQFLTTTAYFDEKGRALQGLTDNIKGGVDYATMQYDFSGKTLSVYERQFFTGLESGKLITVTQLEYNVIGQLKSTSKQYYSLPTKKIASYKYDAYGRLSEKMLSPDFNSNAGIETLKYEYNLNGLLIGINKDYALSVSNSDQWNHYFGMYLGYDNKDNKFADKQYNGNLTGIIWKTQGDNNPRKYDYVYDNADRLTGANFLQRETPGDVNWSNATVDFSMSNVQYDENGNLTTLNHKGIIPGNTSTVFVDKLEYTYLTVGGGAWSNKLNSVLDNSPGLGSTNNGLLGDFKNETYNSPGSYSYDLNGNMVMDNNKKIRIGSGNGIDYNYMDKPQKITIENKSITEFIYDAAGNKLGKKLTNTQTNGVTINWYNAGFVYVETANPTAVALQYISHEEGRVRVYTPVNQPRIALGNYVNLPDGLKGVFEFFVKDNLQNIRAVLSEETHVENHNCTMETNDPNVQTYEQLMFQDQTSTQVVASRINRTPTLNNIWTISGTNAVGGLGDHASKLITNKIGPNMLLKVMAGDKLTMKADYFYNQPYNNTASNLTSTIADAIAVLLGSAISPASQAVKGSGVQIQGTLSNGSGPLAQFLQNQNNNTTASPRAYLNYLFFDESFRFVPYDQTTGLGSYGLAVTNSGDGQWLGASNVKVPKNGYVFVYLSNSSNIDVYFDNLDITHIRGRLVEENAYYPYGLKTKGICGEAFGKLDTKFGYQAEYAEEDDETGWNEFDLRMYNPQIGRWNGVDPYEQYESPYLAMGTNPANFIDKDGGFDGWIGTAIGAAALGTTSYFVARNNGARGWGLAGITAGGVLLGAGIGYSVDMSLVNGASETSSFFANFRAFYAGMFGAKSINTRSTIGKSFVGYGRDACPRLMPISTPNVWDWFPNIISSGVYDFDKWTTVAVNIISPIDFINAPTLAGSTVHDPDYPTNNVFKFNYELHLDPDDRNNRTRTIVKPKQMRVLPNQPRNKTRNKKPIEEFTDDIGCGCSPRAIVEDFFTNFAAPTGNDQLIPTHDFTLVKQKLVGKQYRYIKIFGIKIYLGPNPKKQDKPCDCIE